MKPTADNILKNVPLITGLVVLAGIVKSIVYYSFFGLRIIYYLDLSECLLMFMDDILIISIILIITLGTLEWVFKKNFEDKIVHDHSEDKVETAMMHLDRSFRQMEKIEKLANTVLISLSIFVFAGCLILWHFSNFFYAINCFISLVCMYLIPTQISKVSGFFNRRYKEYADIFKALSFFIIVLLWMANTGFGDANNKRYWPEKKFSYTLASGEKINGSDTCIFIGRTKNYTIFYNPNNGYKRIVPVSEIKEQTIK